MSEFDDFKEYVSKVYPRDTAIKENYPLEELIEMYSDLYDEFLRKNKMTQSFDDAWKENRHVWESTKNLAKAMYLAGAQSKQAEIDDHIKRRMELAKDKQDLLKEIDELKDGVNNASIAIQYIAKEAKKLTDENKRHIDRRVEVTKENHDLSQEVHELKIQQENIKSIYEDVLDELRKKIDERDKLINDFISDLDKTENENNSTSIHDYWRGFGSCAGSAKKILVERFNDLKGTTNEQ